VGSVVRRFLLFDQLAVAGRLFERGEPGRVQHALTSAACELTAAAGGCKGRGRADHASDEKRTRAPDSIVAVHGPSVFLEASDHVTQSLRSESARDRFVGDEEACEVPGGQQETVEIGGRDDRR
jgi:hypothetical protein